MASSLHILTGQDVQWLRHGCISNNHMFSLLQLFATKVQLHVGRTTVYKTCPVMK